jgi:hypothetical protein
MVMRLMVGIALLVLACCQDGERLPVARGSWFGLNGGQYQPTAAELQPPVKQ